jgi:predicted GNAT superfamily acetyltransferase
LRRLEKPDEFRQIEEVERAAFGDATPATIPPTLQRAIQENGGLVLGAFADIYLAGFSLGFLGWDGKELYHYSHLTAVRPEYQNHRVGFRLKEFQRQEILTAGLASIRWTFDPLSSRGAQLGVRALGAEPDRYLPHHAGPEDSSQLPGVPADRLHVRWNIAAPKVEARVSGQRPSSEDDHRRLASAQSLLETTPGETGLRVPSTVHEPSKPLAVIEIPFDIASVREHEPDHLRTWRFACRDAFQGAFDSGYRVDDFAVVPTGHERRSYYFLVRQPASGQHAEAPAASSPAT